MLRPKSLKKGDRLAILGGSSHCETPIEELVKAVENMGLEPVVYESATSSHYYLSGPDELRAGDINAAFADDSIDGIVTTRGGYGSHRVAPLLDLEMIKKHPKFFGGYSDVTTYLNMFTQLCGFETYHMPMISAWAKGMDPFTEKYVKAMLFGEKIGYENPEGYEMKCLQGGTAEGELCGGNLFLAEGTLGTPYEIDTKGKIVLFEAVNKLPYHIDSYLTHLRNCGKFEDAAGFIFGQFKGCFDGNDDTYGDINMPLELMIKELVAPYGKPIITGAMFGHDVPTMSLPIGRRFKMDADNCTFEEA